MSHIRSDLRYAARMLRKHPGFTLVAVITLALGIGANTAIFSVVDAVLLRPLPFPEPERLVQIWETDTRLGGQSSISPLNFADWRAASGTFEELGAYRYTNIILTGGSEPERYIGCNVSAGFFPTLGIAPRLGRTFREDEDAPGAVRVAVLSHGIWERRFAADPDVIGQDVILNNEKVTVVGVMPAGFAFPNRGVDIWTPLALDLTRMGRGRHFLAGIGRMAPETTLAEARQEMDSIATRLSQTFPDSNREMGVLLVPLQEQIVGDARPALLVLLAAVGLVLGIACANVANLFLARASARRREVAIRGALGATRGRLVGQFLTESVLLSILGGALGVLIAQWGVEILVSLNAGDIPRADGIVIDARVLGFTLAVSMIASIAFGLAPALAASTHNPADSLHDAGSRASAGPGGRRLRGALVISELALALVLLVGGGLLIRSFLQLQSVPPGFSTDRVMTMRVALPGSKYPEEHTQAAFFSEALERIGGLPGVEAAGVTQDLPFAGSRTSESFDIEGASQVPGEDRTADYRAVSPGYLEAMSIPLLAGRRLSDSDTADATAVVLINETMAQRFFPDSTPIGRRIMAGRPPSPREIVGIIGDVKHMQLDAAAEPEMYFPHRQRPHGSMFLAVRTAAEPGPLAGSIRRIVAEMDPDQAVFSVRMMEDRVAGSIAPQRFQSALLGGFAVLALLLAVVGVYGVIWYGVSQRTREIGIRMALGAERRDVVRLITAQGLGLAIVGTALGFVAALGLTRALSGLLFGVGAADPLTYAGTSLLLAAAALLASYLPARRATRVHPMTALRHE